MKILLFLSFILFSCSSSTTREIASTHQNQSLFDQTVEEVKAYSVRRSQELSHPQHAPQLLHHGHKTKYVVVFHHGLYESPFYMRKLAQHLFDQGMNVLLPTLSGHWTSPPEKSKKANYQDWIREQRLALSYAWPLGEKVILAGYSTGGLLAVYGTLTEPNISGLILIAPALGLHPEVALASSLGSLLGIHGNGLQDMPAADGKDVPYFAPELGMQVHYLQRHFWKTMLHLSDRNVGEVYRNEKWRIDTYQKIQVPVFLVASEADKIIHPWEVSLFYSSLRGSKDSYFSKDQNHRDLAKDKSDAFPWRPDGYNKEFSAVTRRLTKFLQQHFPN